MKGMGMLLEALLDAFKIDRAEVTTIVENIKRDAPVFVQRLDAKINDIDARLTRIEDLCRQMLRLLDPDHSPDEHSKTLNAGLIDPSFNPVTIGGPNAGPSTSGRN